MDKECPTEWTVARSEVKRSFLSQGTHLGVGSHVAFNQHSFTQWFPQKLFSQHWFSQSICPMYFHTRKILRVHLIWAPTITLHYSSGIGQTLLSRATYSKVQTHTQGRGRWETREGGAILSVKVTTEIKTWAWQWSLKIHNKTVYLTGQN